MPKMLSSKKMREKLSQIESKNEFKVLKRFCWKKLLTSDIIKGQSRCRAQTLVRKLKTNRLLNNIQEQEFEIES